MQKFIVLVLVMLAFSGLLATKCVSMNNQPYMARPSLIYLNPDEFYYYLFIISVDRCNGSCNTFEDPFDRMCVPSKIEDVNFQVFNMMKERNESKILVTGFRQTWKYLENLEK